MLVLLPVYFFPLWNMTFCSNQYTDGLVCISMRFELQGGKTPNRDDLREINSLNHYIGMRPCSKATSVNSSGCPFGIGALMLLTLRALVIGKMANSDRCLCAVLLLRALLALELLPPALYSTGTISIPQPPSKFNPLRRRSLE